MWLDFKEEEEGRTICLTSVINVEIEIVTLEDL